VDNDLPNTERRVTSWRVHSFDFQLEPPTRSRDMGQHHWDPCGSFYCYVTNHHTQQLKAKQICYLRVCGPGIWAEVHQDPQLRALQGHTAVLICNSGASSRLIQIVGRIQSLAIVGLRSPFSCLLSPRDCSQLLEPKVPVIWPMIGSHAMVFAFFQTTKSASL